ncbi:MAG: hypothetical protein CMD33_10235 [Flavobacteriales bacterium]|mgnify:CR=1 FL=1|nr:hypothetical protein [Flavobacteriales bacterium]
MVKFTFTSCLQLLLLCFLSMGMAWSQEAFEVSVNRNPVRVGEQVQLTFTLKNISRRIDGPVIKGLKLLYGPSTSNSTSIYNGTRTSEVGYTFTYQVLSRTNVEIPAFEVQGSQGKLKSKSFVLSVSTKGAKPSGSKTGNLGSVACVIEASKRNLHIGEQVVVSFKIFNNANNLDVRKFNIPETPGFWKEVVDIPEPRWEPQVISGQRYNVATVKKLVLFPQQTGTLSIDGFDLVGYKRTSFFNGQNVTANAKPIKIEVKPLPEPIPPAFLGTFRQLRVTLKQKEQACRTNEAITYDLTFSGKGNIKFIQEPSLTWPGEFEVFDPEVIDQINVNANGESGSRTFRYVVIPRAPGQYELPVAEGAWFNTKNGDYVTLNTKPLRLTVATNNSDESGLVSYNSKTDVQILNQDINFIQSAWKGPCLARNQWDNQGQLAGGLLAIGPLALGLSFVARRRRDEDEKNPLTVRKRRAKNAVRHELKEAKKHTGQPNVFYPALGSGLEAYLMAKLQWNASQLTTSALNEALESHVPGLKEQWNTLLNDLDMARYAPGQVPPPDAMIAAAEALVDATEKNWIA